MNRTSVKTIFTFVFLIVFAFEAFSRPDTSRLLLNNFVVKENLLKNEKIAIIACDEQDNPLESVTGNFRFSINGFTQDLRFIDGVAVAPQPVDKSTFIYLRHRNESGTHGKLYYVIKKDNNLNIIKINWLLLLLIPLGIIFIGMMFRKLLIVAIIATIAIFYFNSDKGLTMPTFMDTIVDGLKSLF